MEYVEWAPVYRRIAEEYGYSLDRERRVADMLLEQLSPPNRVDPLTRLTPRLAGRSVVVVGAAPSSGAPPIWAIPPIAPVAVIAADGAAQSCLKGNVVPSVITTDLDGPVEAEVESNARGAFVLLHAHGDNRASIERWAGEFPGEVGGSWAGPPTEALLNVGGFTDGDRAVFLADHVGARSILLFGFDFEDVSAEADSTRRTKRKKLDWARRLVDRVARGRTDGVRWLRPGGEIEPYVPAPIGPSTQ